MTNPPAERLHVDEVQVPAGASREDLDSELARSLRQLGELYAAEDSRPNVLTLAQFRRYVPLFQHNSNLTPTARQELGRDYYRLIDPYKRTEIIVSTDDPRVLFRLPQIFMQAASLANTTQSGVLSSTNSKASLSQHPVFAKRAFDEMAVALIKEQITPEQIKQIVAQRAEFRAILIDLARNVGRPAPVQDAVTTTAAPAGDWAFDDDGE
jgi:hypothetical protein